MGMMYNEGVFTYTRDSYNDRDTGGRIKPAEYAEMKYVKALATRVAVLEERESKTVTQVANNVQNIEDAYHQIRYNYGAVHDLNMRLNALENASSVAKKKRRVTVCAGNQKVEIIRVDN